MIQKRKGSSEYVLKKGKSGEKRWMLRDPERRERLRNGFERTGEEAITLGALTGGGIIGQKLIQDRAFRKQGKTYQDIIGKLVVDGTIDPKTASRSSKSMSRAVKRIMPYGSVDVESLLTGGIKTNQNKGLDRAAGLALESKNPFTRFDLGTARTSGIGAASIIGASKRLERAGRNKDYTDADIKQAMLQEFGTAQSSNAVGGLVSAGSRMALESSLLQDRLPEKFLRGIDIDDAPGIGLQLKSDVKRSNKYTRNPSIFAYLQRQMTNVNNTNDQLRGIDNAGYSKGSGVFTRKGKNVRTAFNVNDPYYTQGRQFLAEERFRELAGVPYSEAQTLANQFRAKAEGRPIKDQLILNMKKKVIRKELNRTTPAALITDIITGMQPEELDISIFDVKNKLTRTGVIDSPIHTLLTASQNIDDTIAKSMKNERFAQNFLKTTNKIRSKAPRSFRSTGSGKVASEIISEMMADANERLRVGDVMAGTKSYLKKDATKLVKEKGLDAVLRGRSAIKGIAPALLGTAAGIGNYALTSKQQERKQDKKVKEARAKEKREKETMDRINKIQNRNRLL